SLPPNGSPGPGPGAADETAAAKETAALSASENAARRAAGQRGENICWRSPAIARPYRSAAYQATDFRRTTAEWRGRAHAKKSEKTFRAALSGGDRDVFGADRRHERRAAHLLALARDRRDLRQELEDVSRDQHFAHRPALAASDKEPVLDHAGEIAGHWVGASRIASDPDRALAGRDEIGHRGLAGVDFQAVMPDHRKRADSACGVAGAACTVAGGNRFVMVEQEAFEHAGRNKRAANDRHSFAVECARVCAAGQAAVFPDRQHL